MTNTEKSRRRRAKAKTQGAVRINVELRGDLAERWKALAAAHGGATSALAHLVANSARRQVTQGDVLAWIATNTKG